MTTRHRLRHAHRLVSLLSALVAGAALAGCLAPDAVPGADGGAGGGSTGSAGAAAGGGPSGYDLAWARTYGFSEAFDKHALSVAATPEGGALMAGDFEGSLEISPLAALPNTEGRDGFVALLDQDGTATWSRAFSGFGDQRVFRALPAPGGGVLVAGAFTQTLFFDGADQGSGPAGWDGFVAHLGEDLSLDWLVRVGGDGDQVIHTMALTKTGEIIVGGYFESTLQIGDLVTPEKAAGRDFFVARLDQAGQPLWGVSLGGDPVDLGPIVPVCLVAAGGDGGIHVAGTFTGTVRLGQNLGAVGDRDVFVGKLAPDGKPVWGHSAGHPSSEQNAGGLAVNGAGVAVLSGHVQGQSQLDASTTLASDGPEPDAFLAVYGAAGDLLWARRYGSKAQDHGGAVAFDPAGNILFTGRFRGTMHFGTDSVLSNNGAVSNSDDIFLATLTPSGAPLRAAAFGKNDSQTPASVAGTAAGDVLIGGWFRGIVDFGSGDLDAQFGEDLFVVKLASPPN